MKKTLKVTLLVVPVLALVSLGTDFANAAPAKTNKVVMRADQLEKVVEPEVEPVFGTDLQLSRSTSLIDHKDGTRADGMDYLLIPHLNMWFGTIQAKVTYSQNLKDRTGHTYDGTVQASDWGDVPVTYSLTPNKWMWSYPYLLTLTPFITGVIPASQNSTVRDQLQTAASVGMSVAIIPDGIAPKHDGAWNLAISVTAGQNFHAYSTDINGKVLNKYSSNQTLNLGYTHKSVGFSVEFINKSRWTYEGNTKNGFAHSEEIAYAFTDHVGAAIGHTNEGTALKANGLDSNLELVNENDSTAYASLTLSF